MHAKSMSLFSALIYCDLLSLHLKLLSLKINFKDSSDSPALGLCLPKESSTLKDYEKKSMTLQ